MAEPGDGTLTYKRPGFRPWTGGPLCLPADEFSWNFLTWSESKQMGGNRLSGSSEEFTPSRHKL